MSDAHDGRHIVVRPHHLHDLCVMPPAPPLRERMDAELAELRDSADSFLAPRLRLSETDRVGFNDGLIIPGTRYPVGTPAEVARRAALDRAPLRGIIRVAVVLVDFPDRPMAEGAADRFRDLFFSTGLLEHGSVKEYYTDVSAGLITLDGEIAGPYTLPRPLAAYAGAENGTQASEPNARTMANDAFSAADPDIDFTPYDNDGNGYVDAFIVVHAGRGAEETGAMGDIWSHKWVLPAERAADGTRVFGYLTIPEDAKIGVCAHELGHLLFGWPDLYDTDYSSAGIGDWCLMAAGSWGLGGDRPVHPSAWCKVNQGWVDVVKQTVDGTVTVNEVKAGRIVYRLWKDGAIGTEYFLLENRQRDGYDASLPGDGLLVWHIDDALSTNRDERHYKVALVQADGRKDMEGNANQGDDGDPFPGSAHNVTFGDSSGPSSKSYAGAATSVSITEIPEASASMTVRLGVQSTVQPPSNLDDVAEQLRKLDARVAAVEAAISRLQGGGSETPPIA
jgi:immune inhibitor A